MNIAKITISSALFIFANLLSAHAHAFCMVSSNYQTIASVLYDNVIVSCSPGTPVANLLKEIFENAGLSSPQGVRTDTDGGIWENVGMMSAWAPIGKIQTRAYFSKDTLHPERYQYWFNISFSGELAKKMFQVLTSSKPVVSGKPEYLFHTFEQQDDETLSRFHCVTKNGEVETCGLSSWTYYKDIH